MSEQCKYPPFTNAMFIERSKFHEQFRKGSPKEHFYEIISKSDPGFREEDLYRICKCLYSESSPHSREPCLMTDQNFATNF